MSSESPLTLSKGISNKALGLFSCPWAGTLPVTQPQGIHIHDYVASCSVPLPKKNKRKKPKQNIRVTLCSQAETKDQDKQCFAFILSLACSLNNRILFYITIKLTSENRPGTPFRSSVPRPVHSNRFRPVQASWISLLCFILNGLKLWNVLLS